MLESYKDARDKASPCSLKGWSIRGASKTTAELNKALTLHKASWHEADQMNCHNSTLSNLQLSQQNIQILK